MTDELRRLERCYQSHRDLSVYNDGMKKIEHTEKSDVWALGMTFRKLFNGTSKVACYQPSVSQNTKYLIEDMMLQPISKQRLGATDVSSKLKQMLSGAEK